MTETVTAGPDEPDKSESQGGYLPKLPDGWRYDVRLMAPRGITQEISVCANPFQMGGWTTQVKSHSEAGGVRSLTSDGLTAAARIAANAAKSLARIHAKEKELETERANLLGTLATEDDAEVDAGVIATAEGTMTVHGDGTIAADAIRTEVGPDTDAKR